MHAFISAIAEVSLPISWSFLIGGVLLILQRPGLTGAARTGDEEVIDRVTRRYRLGLALLVQGGAIMILHYVQFPPDLLTFMFLASPLAGVYGYHVAGSEVEEWAHQAILDVEREEVDSHRSPSDSQER